MRPNDRHRTPIWIWLDPTRRCNISCALCYTKQAHDSQDLTEHTLARILEQVTNSSLIEPQELTFNWRGEPLMNRRFHLLLKQISESALNCPIQFHTNAMLLTPSRASELVECADRVTIYVSIDGGSAVSHDRNRGHGSFELSLQGAENLLSARGARRWPRVVVYQLDLRELEADFDPRFLSLTERVDGWQVVTPVLPDGDGRPFLNAPLTRGGANIVDRWEELSRDQPIPQGPCFFAGNALVVAPDGLASICILSHDPTGVIGNLLTDSIDSIVSRARTWREMLRREGRSAIPHCAHCRKCEGIGRPRNGDRAHERYMRTGTT